MIRRPLLSLGALVGMSVLPGCVGGLQGTTTAWDDDVPAELRARLDVLDARVADAIRAGDAAALLELVPEPYRRTWGAPEAIAQSLAGLKAAEAGSPPPLWHVAHGKFSSADGMTMTLIPRVITEPKAFFVYADSVRESVAVTFRKVKLGGGEVLLAATWIPEAGDWALHGLRTGALSLGEKDALDWYEEITRLKRDGKVIAAAVRGALVRQLLRPVPTMQYVRQPEILEEVEALQKVVDSRHKWPLVVEGLGFEVSLFGLLPLVLAEDRSFNVVVPYVSPGTALSDAAVSAQASALHQRVLLLFPDVCENTRRIIYRAYQEPPVDPKRTYPYYGVPIDCAAR